MKVLLVNPNRMKPAIAPIALDYLADSLEAGGFAVDVLDLCFAPDPDAPVDASFAGIAPGLVAFSIRNTDDCYFTGQDFFLPAYRQMLQRIQTKTAAPTVFGGAGFLTA